MSFNKKVYSLQEVINYFSSLDCDDDDEDSGEDISDGSHDEIESNISNFNEDCTNVEDIEININNLDEDRAIVDVDNENIKEMEVESPLDYHIVNENQVSNLWTCPNFLNSTWKPANGELPTLHQFLGQPGFNVEISDSRPITYY